MTPAERLARALAHSSASGDDAESARKKGRYVVRAAQLEALGNLLAARGLDAMLVKGAALALGAYDPPWSRDMSDIDVIARPGQVDRVAAALESAGYTRYYPERRPLTHASLGELQMLPPAQPRHVVEIHRHLDKVSVRPIDYASIFSRAHPAHGLAALLVPSTEDHLLLIALHASTHDFHHDEAYADVDRLLRLGVDREALRERAAAWDLSNVLYVMFATMLAFGASTVDASLVRAYEPPPFRRRAIESIYRIGSYPLVASTRRWGAPLLARQSVLRDRLGAFAASVARYSALRATERALARWL